MKEKENEDLTSALKELDKFKSEMENLFKAISPAHREEKLPPLFNHIGHILVYIGETLQEGRTQQLAIRWLSVYEKEINAIVDFFYGYIDVLKLMARKIFKLDDLISTEPNVDQKILDKQFGAKMKKLGVRIMNHIYDIQSLFKR